MKSIHLYLLLLISIFSACEQEDITTSEVKEPKLPEQPYDYKTLQLPLNTHPGMVTFNNITPDMIMIDPAFNGQSLSSMKVTDEGASLGRVLFYDKQLSINNTIACGTCHHQDKAFTDGLAISKGFEGKTTDRSSMAIINPIVQNNLFWDSRSFSIQDLSLKPVQNHIEMGMEKLHRLEDKLNNVEYYRALFEEAYGSGRVTSEHISLALSEFVASITSSNSKFDQGNFSELENRGRVLFDQKCGSCHAGANFSAEDGPGGEYGVSFDNLTGTGIQNLKGTTNIGLEVVSSDQGFEGKFRIPTLRNIMLTAPYMHDGRLKTIDDVLDHYSSNIKPNVHLDKKFKDAQGRVKMISMNFAEKEAIKAFLHTLTDYTMITDPKYSDPFKY